MTESEIKALEALLEKMQAELGSRFCVVVGAVRDGFHVATYDQKGEIDKTATGPTLSAVIEKIHGERKVIRSF